MNLLVFDFLLFFDSDCNTFFYFLFELLSMNNFLFYECRDLDEALPALAEAVQCLKDLKRADIDEVKSLEIL